MARLKEERAVVSAHVPLVLRRQMIEHATLGERTLSGEIRRALDFYARSEYQERPAPAAASQVTSR